jgi:hypothetical protein
MSEKISVSKKNLYSLLEKVQSFTYSEQRFEILTLLCYELRETFGLKDEEMTFFLNQSCKKRERCKKVKEDGTKCLHLVVPNEEVCDKHL